MHVQLAAAGKKDGWEVGWLGRRMVGKKDGWDKGWLGRGMVGIKDGWEEGRLGRGAVGKRDGWEEGLCVLQRDFVSSVSTEGRSSR